MYTVYMLRCAGNTLYTGVAKDVQKRFALHQQGKGARYTRAHRPIRIVYTERVRTRSAALKREYVLKQMTRAQKDLSIQAYRSRLARRSE